MARDALALELLLRQNEPFFAVRSIAAGTS